MTSSGNLLNQIEYITVLMFENRSFDDILGALYPLTYTSNGNTFAGLPPSEVNYVPAVAPGTKPTTQKSYQVWTDDPPNTDWTASYQRKITCWPETESRPALRGCWIWRAPPTIRDPR